MQLKVLRAVSLYGERREIGEVVDIPEEMAVNIGFDYLDPVVVANLPAEPQAPAEEVVEDVSEAPAESQEPAPETENVPSEQPAEENVA